MTKHTTLYRKYRPETFDQVRGQDHIVQALQTAIASNQIGHAYIFSGDRGTGKTTMARIFAQAIGTDRVDLYEIDAASHTGVDNIRSLTESVQTLPLESQYKVYIIDEAHMLSKSAFNALLKTLEEPPAHVIFILATTEPHKILDTIISRCQVYTFRNPHEQLLQEMVMDVAKSEGKKLDTDAADLIALLGNGSFRDTLTILQNAITTITSSPITADDVAKLTGAPTNQLIHDWLAALNTGDLGRVLELIYTAEEQNLDLVTFVDMAMQKIRTIMLLRFAPNLKTRIAADVSADELERLQKLSTAEGINLNAGLLSRLLMAERDMRITQHSSIPLIIHLTEHLKTTTA